MPPKIQIHLSDLLQTLATNDLRFETILNSIIELLQEKKMPDGTPIFTANEVAKKADEIAKRINDEMKIVKSLSPLILPPGMANS